MALSAKNTMAINDHFKPLLENRICQYCDAKKILYADIPISETVLDNIITQVISIESAHLASERQFYTVSVHIGDAIIVDSHGKFTQQDLMSTVPAGRGVGIGVIGGVATGAGIGSLTGSIGGPIGSSIGAAIGAISGAVAGDRIGRSVARYFARDISVPSAEVQDISVPLAEVLRPLGTATETEDRLSVTIRMDNAPLQTTL